MSPIPPVTRRNSKPNTDVGATDLVGRRSKGGPFDNRQQTEPPVVHLPDASDLSLTTASEDIGADQEDSRGSIFGCPFHSVEEFVSIDTLSEVFTEEVKSKPPTTAASEL